MSTKHRINRHDRINHYGIDTVSRIIWTKWEVGGRYNKSLTFRNVSSAARTIQYNIPDLNVFYMEFPEPVKLNPGMSYTTQISFRPIHYKSYQDVIQVHTDLGDFVIGIHAETLSLNVSIPDSIDFSFCPVGINSSQQFSVMNSSLCATTVSWSIQQPFCIRPTSANISPQQSQIFHCSLQPDIAAVHKAEARCTITGASGVESETRSVSVQAISKYAHIEVDSDQVEFGLVPLDRHEYRYITIRNLSLVPAHIHCQRSTAGQQDPFWLQLPADNIPIGPESSATITVHYKAGQLGQRSVQQFQIGCTGGNTVPLICRGTGLGPSLRIEPEYIDFKDIELGNSSHQSVVLCNDSEYVPVRYEIIGGYGVFQLGSRSGEIQPGLSINIRIRFRPDQAINYYERLEILVYQGSPLFVHMIATCFSRDIRPAQFTIDQLKQYHQRCAVNLGLVSPQSLQHRIDQYRDKIDSAPIITNLSPGPSRFDSYFRVTEIRAAEIVESGIGIQFGSCLIADGVKTRQVHVQNHTETKISIIWHDEVVRNSLFIIRPKRQDIRPQSSAEFELGFHPQHDHRYYSRNISATVYFKVNRSFRLVTDSTFCPPWNLIVPVFGNTFSHGAEHFFPVGGFHPAHIQLPAVRPGQVSYGTVRLDNQGSTPIHFLFTRTSTDDDILQLKPGSGCVRPNAFAIIALRFSPKQIGSVHFDFECVVNYTQKWLLNVTAEAEQVLVKFQPKSTIYFPPSCPGSISSRSQTISNITQIPAAFRINIDQSLRDVLKAEPDHGYILGNDSVEVVWSLNRPHQQRIVSKVICDLFHDLHDQAPCTSIPLMIKADAGRLSADLELIDADVTSISIVGVSCTHRLRLINNSDCELIYKLDCKMLSQLSFDYDLRLDQDSGSLPGHGSTIIDCIITLWGRSSYQVYIACSVPSAHNQICDITVSGETVLPSLQIVDIFSDDIPVSSMDKLFRPDLINMCLSNDLSKFESDLQKFGPSPDLCWTSEYMSQYIPTYTCRLMPRLLGHTSTCTVIRLQNTGPVPVQLQIHGPTALDLDHELWVDPEQRSAQQQQYIQIIKNEFVRFEPERAHIAVNEFVDIVLTCSHSLVQSIQLPLIFDISLGKKFICHLSVDTVLHNLRAVTLLDRCHELEPMPIGLQEHNVSIQQVRLHNNCAVPVQFQINDEEFLRTNETAVGYPVLQCLTKQGVIQPNDVIDVAIKFRPLQPITYRSKLEVVVPNGTTEQFEITGRGFVPGAKICNTLKSVYNATIRPENRLAVLYPYIIQTGQMSFNSSTEHIVFIENISNDQICFEFCKESRASDIDVNIEIEPRKAVLDAGQRVLVHVNISAGSIIQRLSKLIRICFCRVSQQSGLDSQPNLGKMFDFRREGLAYHNTIRSRMASKTLFKPIDTSREWSINNQLQKPLMSSSLWLEIQGDITAAPVESLPPFVPLITDFNSQQTSGMDLQQQKSMVYSFLGDMISKKQYQPIPGARQLIPFFVHLPDGPLLNPTETAQDLEGYVGEKLLQHRVRTTAESRPTHQKSTETFLHDSSFYRTAQQLINEIMLDLIHDIDNEEFKIDTPPKQIVVKGLVFK